MFDITHLFQGVFLLITIIVVRILIPAYKKYAVPWLESKVGKAKLDHITAVIVKLVYAAEGIYRESGSGKNKLAYVQDQLKLRGFKVDTSLIESTIQECINYGRDYNAELYKDGEDLEIAAVKVAFAVDSPETHPPDDEGASAGGNAGNISGNNGNSFGSISV
jgi:hypothetical protein